MKKPDAAIHYQIDVHDLHAHVWQVSLTIPQPQAVQTLQLPVWIPGSYMVREFSKQLSLLTAHQAGRTCEVTQTAKATWHVHADESQALTLRYQVHAYDASVRTAWLDALRGFFNPTSLCLMACGFEQLPHTVHISQPNGCPDWQLATALKPVKINAKGFGLYTAADYDELADSPVEMSAFWSGQFTAKVCRTKWWSAAQLPLSMVHVCSKTCKAFVKLKSVFGTANPSLCMTGMCFSSTQWPTAMAAWNTNTALP